MDIVNGIIDSSEYALSQLKKDGRYANAIIRSGDVELESRQGEITFLEGASFLEDLSKMDDCVLNGELTVDGYTTTGSAIAASVILVQAGILDHA